MRLIDHFAAVLVAWFGVIFLAGSAVNYLRGEALDWTSMLLLIGGVACVWLGVRAPFPTKERA